MKIRFSGETFDVPPPVSAADETVLIVEKYIPVELPVSGTAAPPMVSLLNLRKLLFFFLREGVSLTLAKIRAVLSHWKLGENRALIVALGRDEATGMPVVALGGQDCPYAERLCFRRSLAAVQGGAAQDLEADAAALLAYCAANPDIAAALRDWSRFSGRKPPVTLIDALAEGRRLLAAGTAPASATAVPVHFESAAVPIETRRPIAGGRSALFLAGAGKYPCAYALPVFARAGIPFDTVIDLNPARAARVAKRFGFASADTDAARGLRRLADYEAPMLLIATYHASHLEIAELALAINPATRIMLEKPPVATIDQLHRLDRLRRGGAYIEIGYNRRHPPMIAQARDRLATQDGPIVMTCIVKVPRIPPSHWYFWPAQGTRVTGNACHWIDLGRYFIGAEAERLVVAGPHEGAADGTISLIVCYADGSRATIVVTDNGNSLRGVQEFIELRRGDLTVTIDDFLRVRVEDGARQSVRRRLIRDKGHGRMYARFIDNVRQGRAPEYPDDELLATSLPYLLASAALKTGDSVADIDLRAASALPDERPKAPLLVLSRGGLAER
jgi:predicted dehydrogenase